MTDQPQTPAPALLTLRLLQVASDSSVSDADRVWSVTVEALWLLIGVTPRGLAVRARLEQAYDELTDRGGDRTELVGQARGHLTGLTDHVAQVGLDLLDAYIRVTTVDAL